MAFTNPERRVPRWWLRDLYRFAGSDRIDPSFDTSYAVWLYTTLRKPSPRLACPDLGWVKMNARNALSCAVQVGWLKRLKKGLYRFTAKGRKVARSVKTKHN